MFDSAGDEVDSGFRDRNGNTVTRTSSGGATTWTDPLGTAATETGAGTPASPLVFTYTGPNSTSAQITERFETISASTAFGCTGIGEYSGSATVPSELDLADGSRYLFGYDLQARLTSVTLPTGGTINYGYTFDCADAGNSQLTRSTSVNPGTWTWTRTHPTGNASLATTEADPSGQGPTVFFTAYNSATLWDFLARPSHDWHHHINQRLRRHPADYLHPASRCDSEPLRGGGVEL